MKTYVTDNYVPISIRPADQRILAARMQRSLRRNVLWNLFGNCAYAASQWGILIVFAKLGSTEVVGQFAMALAITAPIILFCNMQLATLQATDASRRFNFQDYFALRILTSTIAMIAIAAIAVYGEFNVTQRVLIIVIGASKFVESISDILSGVFQQNERLDYCAISNLVRGHLSFFVVLGCLLAGGDVKWATAAILAVWLFVLLAIDVRNCGKLVSTTMRRASRCLPSPRWYWKTLAKIAWTALPLGAVMMFMSLNYNIPRYFIQYYCGESQLGIFAALAYLLVALNLVVNSVAQAASPRLAKYFFQSERRKALKLLFLLCLVSVVIAGAAIAAGIFGGSTLLSVLYRSEYAPYSTEFVWLMTAGMIGNVAAVLGFGMTAARCLKIQLPLFCLVCLGTAYACQELIPHYGLRGAAWAMCFGFGVQLLGSLLVLSHAFIKSHNQLDAGVQA